jgi:hypothetical protein
MIEKNEILSLEINPKKSNKKAEGSLRNALILQNVAEKRFGFIKNEIKNKKITVVIDWLAVYFKDYYFNVEKMVDTEGIAYLTEDLFYKLENGGTQHFKNRFYVFYKNEHAATIMTTPVNETQIKKEVIKIDFVNHTFYSGVVWQVYDLLVDCLSLEYKSVSRLDIAIDGMNWIHKALNIFAKQNIKNQIVQLKNSSTKRARFNAKVLNPKTMLYENFNIGHLGAYKMITVYNKSLELLLSGKTYIQDYWKLNGVVNNLVDIEGLRSFAKKTHKITLKNKKDSNVDNFEDVDLDVEKLMSLLTDEEKIKFNVNTESVYRFELRLKGNCIAEIENFSIDMLRTVSGLMSILKLHTTRFFELYDCSRVKIKDCKKIDLIPFEKFEIVELTRIRRVETDGLYKAKLTIHGLIQDVFKGYVKDILITEAVSLVMDRINKYNIADWLIMNMPKYEADYSNFIDESRFDIVYSFWEDLKHNLEKLKQSEGNIKTEFAHKHYTEMVNMAQLANDNHQAMATAMFGDSLPSFN